MAVENIGNLVPTKIPALVDDVREERPEIVDRLRIDKEYILVR